MTSKAIRSAALLLPLVALTTNIAGAAPNDKPTKMREATLEEKEFFAEAQKSLDEHLKKTNEACGTKITAKYDVDSFVQADAGTTYIRPPCEGALNAVREVCRTDAGKATIAAKITRFECRYSAGDTRASLDKKTLTAHINPKKTAIVGKEKGSYSWLSAVKELL